MLLLLQHLMYLQTGLRGSLYVVEPLTKAPHGFLCKRGFYIDILRSIKRGE